MPANFPNFRTAPGSNYARFRRGTRKGDLYCSTTLRCFHCGDEHIAVLPAAHDAPSECPSCGEMSCVKMVDPTVFNRYTGIEKAAPE